ncbi:MAG TPA: 50S ribosomal protein L29 [Candidatus Omnitrophota bacterium]|jgi:large subunit ribosomal protein L29|nr:MAG: 50S ribosomal protein L29 [Candidatus Omnitrophica bacterium ADurb.Bin314]HOE68261.1 50S ribosomal protein L29 [Candidatus Omnitrophota bacterium]HPW65354.1 50S ribosomal protein L29 [Candidatus Omnitrophota bacterium]HQB93811.1 50S ribosomal protein L29 [Candidatus Omnitrophota bacterium]
MLKTSELRELGIEELQTKVLNLKKDLMQLRFQQKTGKLERQNALSQTKRDIARILTVINETKKAGKKK